MKHDTLQVAMYVHRSNDGTFYVVLESPEFGFGFPVARTKNQGEILALLDQVGYRLDTGDPIRSVDPTLTLRMNRFGHAPPENTQIEEVRRQIDLGDSFELVTYNVHMYFDEAIGEMVALP